MTIQLFDLTDATRQVFFSPYCWRTRMALKHKDLAFESLPWHFTDTDKLPATSAKRVPIIVDGGTILGESGDIAAYLEKAYPDRPALFADDAARARAKFIEAWCVTSLFPTLRPIAVPAVFEIIAEKDKVYFRESREKMLRVKLEELSTDPAGEADAMNNALAPVNAALGEADYLAGIHPDYSDYILFGTLMWPYTVCRENPLDMSSPAGQWFDRMLDQFDGYARNAGRAADKT